VRVLPKTELMTESLFFGIDHARSAIAEWRRDFNTARPHSSLGYQTPRPGNQTGDPIHNCLTPPKVVSRKWWKLEGGVISG
jgi:hypothetical protein